ncbi:ATP-binding protein [Georgenia thermotolerans]|uniref:PspC domain-containing protein n=1 Tax=Georgenia thermotolerans TaxID=527326 RepID=A0A7J5ULK2_9MICO|nr:ATP-binding protein [Georgenia thermotolerans]KAE8763160.1 PspC domain-containing protein [Georgenia thermotolerans]
MTASAAPRARLPLRRPTSGRVLGGVAAGVAAHLGWPVGAVRWAFVLTSLVAGAGVAMYLWLWATVPAGDPHDAAPAGRTRLAPRLRVGQLTPGARDVTLAVVLLGTAALLLLWRTDRAQPATWLVPLLIVAAGAALAWGQLAEVSRTGVSARRRGAVVLRVVAGVGLAVLGALLLVGRGESLVVLLRGAAAGLAIVAGVAVVLAPLLLRLVRELGAEREARAREAERADIAAHLHDSVLQTLSMIRSRAAGNEDVARLARAQERELREWLYTDRPAPGTSTADDVRRVAAEVEDRHGVPIEVVTAGDAVPDAGTPAITAATREALANAVVHGRPPVSLYVEVDPERVEVFVRDRGDGFELDAVPDDRHGVRESIIGRMRRHGGDAEIRTRATGTEVHLTMPRKGQP